MLLEARMTAAEFQGSPNAQTGPALEMTGRRHHVHTANSKAHQRQCCSTARRSNNDRDGFEMESGLGPVLGRSRSRQTVQPELAAARKHILGREAKDVANRMTEMR